MADSDASWGVWFESVRGKLAAKSRREGNCLLWTGATKRCNPTSQPYGVMFLKPPVLAGYCPARPARKTYRTHVLAYALHNPDVRAAIFRRRRWDISHLCHVSLCLESSHLSAEPRSINNSRKYCRTSRVCVGHAGFPNCVL